MPLGFTCSGTTAVEKAERIAVVLVVKKHYDLVVIGTSCAILGRLWGACCVAGSKSMNTAAYL